jgi:hypothetical protein
MQTEMPTAQHGSLTVSPRRKNLHLSVTIKGLRCATAGSLAEVKAQQQRLIY